MITRSTAYAVSLYGAAGQNPLLVSAGRRESSRVSTKSRRASERRASPVSPPSEQTIRALTATLTPSLEGDRERLARIYSNFLYVYGDLPPSTQTKLSVLVRAIEGMSWLRYARSFPALSPERREALCRWLLDAPVGRLQAGFAGLRSLILNATYTEPVMWDRIDYAGPTLENGSRRTSAPPPPADNP